MIEGEEQEEPLNTLAETPQEEVRTIEEDIYVIGVESLNGQAGDLTLKSINGENLVGEGSIALQTPLNQAQLDAVNSGIDSTKVEQIATNATNITTLQNTKQDNLTQPQLNAVNSGIDATKVAQIATNTGNITSNTNRLTTIEGKIPSAASSSNKLTDKNYVDNAITTNTANYISDNGQPFQSYADLVAYSGPLTNNDYAFVETIDQAGNDIYTRYKYNASQDLWAEEYTITNPYFTSDQWASINSGIAANDVAQIGTNKTDIATLQTSKQDKLTTAQQAAVDSGIDATKVTQIATNATNIAGLQTGKQDKLTAGTNIQINGTTISATDTKYTAGTGLTLTGTQFSVTEPVPSGFFTDTTTSQTSEGTALTINGTGEAPLKNVELKGNTYQQTYSGKNLLPCLDGSVTVNGITATIADGVLTLNGTSSGVGIIKLTNGLVTSTGTSTPQASWLAETMPISNLQGHTISLSYESGTPTTNSCAFRLYTNSTAHINQWYPSASSQTYTWAGQTIAPSCLCFFFNNGLTFTNYKVAIQIENGTSATNFEKFVGGIPSPNPDYPQDIQVVTGEQTVKVTGKNLFDRANASDNTVLKWSDANNNTEADSIVGDYIATSEGQQFSSNFSMIIFCYDESKVYLGTIQNNGTTLAKLAGKVARTLTIPSGYNVKYIRIEFRTSHNQSLDMTQQDIMVNLGSTATAYQPYQSQSYEVNLGKNLFTTNAWSLVKVSGGYPQSDNTRSTIDSSGTNNVEFSVLSTGYGGVESDYFKVNKGETYTISFTSTKLPNRIYVTQYDASKMRVSTLNDVTQLTDTTITATDDGYITVAFANTAEGSGYNLNNIQLEVGSTATSYAPYFTPIELCKIGDHQDYIWKDGSDWKVHKALGKVVLGGEEIWSTWSAGSQTNTLAFRAVGFPPNIMGSASTSDLSYRLKSSHFTVHPQGALYSTDMVGMATTSYNLYARILKSNLSTQDLTGFNNWLTTNKPTVYYALATPTDTAITDETFIGQLDALWNATTYNPQTNITSTTATPNLPAILTIDTFKNNWAGTLAGYQETIKRLEARVEDLEA